MQRSNFLRRVFALVWLEMTDLRTQVPTLHFHAVQPPCKAQHRLLQLVRQTLRKREKKIFNYSCQSKQHSMDEGFLFSLFQANRKGQQICRLSFSFFFLRFKLRISSWLDIKLAIPGKAQHKFAKPYLRSGKMCGCVLCGPGKCPAQPVIQSVYQRETVRECCQRTRSWTSCQLS